MFRFRNERRWQYVVDKDLQTKIVIAASWPIAVASVISLAILLVFGAHLKRLALESGVDVTGLAPLFVVATILFIYVIVSQVILSLKLSHRIAGSTHRIAKTLVAYRNGERELRVQLRDGDLHGSLADQVNGFLDWVDLEAMAAGRPARSRPELAPPAQPAPSPAERQ
jgi:hypothetical protein